MQVQVKTMMTLRKKWKEILALLILYLLERKSKKLLVNLVPRRMRKKLKLKSLGLMMMPKKQKKIKTRKTKWQNLNCSERENVALVEMV
jgi:hypothetical protein